MVKRGQVSVYLIIGIVFLIVVGLIYFISSDFLKSNLNAKAQAEKNIPLEAQPIHDYVITCLEKTTKEGLVFIGQQGGYYDLPKKSIQTYPYYYSNNKSTAPSKETVESELSKYLNLAIPICTKNFVEFENTEIEANPKLQSNVTILEDKVLVNTHYDINIKKAGITTTLSEFSTEISSDFFKIYSVAINITNQQQENPDYMCASCINRIITQNNLYLEMSNYPNSTVVYTITNKKSTITNGNYEFDFAYKY